jgi:hypothetical protein
MTLNPNHLVAGYPDVESALDDGPPTLVAR